MDLTTLPNGVAEVRWRRDHGGGPAGRRAACQIDDSPTYGPVGERPGVHRLVVQAATCSGPTCGSPRDWVLTASGPPRRHARARRALDRRAAPARVVETRRVVATRSRCATSRSIRAGPTPTAIRSRAVPLVVSGSGTGRSSIESSIVAPIARRRGRRDRLAGRRRHASCSREAQARGANRRSLRPGRCTPGSASPCSATSSSSGSTRRKTLVIGKVDVADTQDGCFRFSAAPAGQPAAASVRVAPARRRPRDPRRRRRFGDPDYASSSEAAPL